MPFAITRNDVLAVWPKNGRCPALGIVLDAGRGKSHDGSPTLDRLRPSKGYVRGNIVVLSKRANQIKSNGTARDLEKIAAWMRVRGLV